MDRVEEIYVVLDKDETSKDSNGNPNGVWAFGNSRGIQPLFYTNHASQKIRYFIKKMADEMKIKGGHDYQIVKFKRVYE